MSDDRQSALWMDTNRMRYFLIPADATIPVGETILYALDGRQCQVDPAGLAAFEITQDQARHVLQAQVDQALAQTRQALSTLVALARDEPPEIAQSTARPWDQSQQGLKALAALLDMSPQDLPDNPQAVQTGLMHLIGELKEMAEGVFNQEASQLQVAQVRLNAWQEKLEAQGIDLGIDLRQLPTRLSAWYNSADREQNLRAVSAHLRELADQLDQMAPSQPGLAFTFSGMWSGLFLDPEAEARRREQQEQAYRQSVQASLSDAMASCQLPPLGLNDLLSTPTEPDA